MSIYQPGDMALYFNGERIPAANFQIGTEGLKPLGKYGILSAKPITFTVPVQFTAEDMGAMQKLLDQLSRHTRRQKKGGARWRKELRRHLVRCAGLADRPACRSITDTMKIIYSAYGVRIPRSLR
jgi:hypothetical protein